MPVVPSSPRHRLRRPLALGAVLLAASGCSTTPPATAAEPLPTETWTGTMSANAVRALPASLATSPGALELVVGATRLTADDVSTDRGRLRFRAPQFPVSRTERRTLRCTLSGWPGERLTGTCQAGAERYRLVLSTSAFLR